MSCSYLKIFQKCFLSFLYGTTTALLFSRRKNFFSLFCNNKSIRIHNKDKPSFGFGYYRIYISCSSLSISFFIWLSIFLELHLYIYCLFISLYIQMCLSSLLICLSARIFKIYTYVSDIYEYFFFFHHVVTGYSPTYRVTCSIVYLASPPVMPLSSKASVAIIGSLIVRLQIPHFKEKNIQAEYEWRENHHIIRIQRMTRIGIRMIWRHARLKSGALSFVRVNTRLRSHYCPARWPSEPPTHDEGRWCFTVEKLSNIHHNKKKHPVKGMRKLMQASGNSRLNAEKGK